MPDIETAKHTKENSQGGHATTEDKKELQSFLGIINNPSKLPPMTPEVCEPLQKLTSLKTDWTWNRMYQDLYD